MIGRVVGRDEELRIITGDSSFCFRFFLVLSNLKYGIMTPRYPVHPLSQPINKKNRINEFLLKKSTQPSNVEGKRSKLRSTKMVLLVLQIKSFFL